MFLAPSGRRASAEERRHIRNCLECRRACLRAAMAALERHGPEASAPLVSTMLDCAQACLIAADFIMRMPSLRAELCAACAAACEACAESCRRMASGLRGMQECAEDCWRRADTCRGTVPVSSAGAVVS